MLSVMVKKEGPITLSGVGCCLVDEIFNDINFTGPSVSNYRCLIPGDGGLTPGQLVFSEEFENFSGDDFRDALKTITGGRKPDVVNVGGPSIVALIHAAQLLSEGTSKICFYGILGDDREARFLEENLAKTPVEIQRWKRSDKPTASTAVLSDPNYDGGHGERMFINTIGAAWDLNASDLDEDFFNSDIVVFGGTALVPGIHDHLTSLLAKSKKQGAITVVNTVFDFRNQKENPEMPWPLGEGNSYPLIDILITDHEEALRLSGRENMMEAAIYFQREGVSSCIITNGSKDIATFSDGRFFKKMDLSYLPVSSAIVAELKQGKKGDTTGCGDNFVGGVLASIVNQLEMGADNLDLVEACAWGIISGGAACFYMGGTFYESNPGEKLSLMIPYLESYRKQIADKSI